MRMVRISWRDAVKRFRVIRCRGCAAEDNGREWFVEKGSRPLNGPYCPSCAASIVGAKDAAHSEHQFYTDTRGEGVRYEI